MEFIGLKGKKIIITGAASGIGKETAITLSSLGATLALMDFDLEKLNDVLHSLEGGGHMAEVIDLSDFSVIADAVKRIVSSIGPVSGLVHCAGISSRKPLNVLKPAGFEKIMAVNFFSFEELVRLLCKRGNFEDGGSIVVMSSISSIKGYKAKTEYCVSKAAVDAFVRCAALELAPRRIRVNSVMAAEVLTPLAAKAREINEALRVETINAPLGPSEPGEVANTIAFLLSDLTKTITGTALLIDGGAMLV